MLGRTQFYQDRSAEAEAAFRKAMEINPHRWGRGFLIQLMVQQGRIADAVTLNAGESGEEYRLLNRVFIHWAEGKREESRRLLAEIVERYPLYLAWQIVQGYACLGDADKVFEWLDRCHEQHDPGGHWAQVDPLLRPYHADSRWLPMMGKLGFSA